MNRIAFLIPVSERGLEKLQQHGQAWEIRKNEPDGTMLIESQGKTFQAAPGEPWRTDLRWIHRHQDPDFDVEIRERTS